MTTENTVYGRNPVKEALRGQRSVKRIWVHGRVENETWLKDAGEGGIETRQGSLSEIESLAGSEAHQGVVAEVDPYKYVQVESILSDPGLFVLALDQIQDPHNLGAIARVAECAGVAGLVIPERRSAAVTAAVCSASSGAVEHLKIARVRNMADFLLEAKKTEYWVYGASADADTVYTEVDMNGPVVLALGSEGKGLRPRVAKSCDALVSIPLAGQVESLNVSSAAAVLAFEAARQRL